jgi:Arm domain-containing DNA-binding protein
VWRFRFRFPLRSPETKETYISLGRYSDITLERARQIRDLACRDIVNEASSVHIPSSHRITDDGMVSCAVSLGWCLNGEFHGDG